MEKRNVSGEAEHLLNQIHEIAMGDDWKKVSITMNNREQTIAMVKSVERKLSSIAELVQVILGD